MYYIGTQLKCTKRLKKSSAINQLLEALPLAIKMRTGLTANVLWRKTRVYSVTSELISATEHLSGEPPKSEVLLIASTLLVVKAEKEIYLLNLLYTLYIILYYMDIDMLKSHRSKMGDIYIYIYINIYVYIYIYKNFVCQCSISIYISKIRHLLFNEHIYIYMLI